jgi:hypothetical protein
VARFFTGVEERRFRGGKARLKKSMLKNQAFYAVCECFSNSAFGVFAGVDTHGRTLKSAMTTIGTAMISHRNDRIIFCLIVFIDVTPLCAQFEAKTPYRFDFHADADSFFSQGA